MAQRKSLSRNKKKCMRLSYTGLVIFTLIMMIPFLFVIMLSFKNNTDILMDPLSLPKSLDFTNYINAMETLNPFRLIGNTLLVAALTMAIEMVITFLSSVALTRMVFRKQKTQTFLYSFLLLGLAIPIYVLLFPIYRMTVLFGIKGSHLSLILPYIATSVSFNTLIFTGFLREFPSELEEAAIIDGCSLWQTIWKIMVPIVKPVLVTVFIFNVLYIWNEFPLAVTLISDEKMATISLGISMFKGRYTIDYGGIIAASLMIMTPQVIFYGFFQKYIIEGMTAGAVKG
ncbi:carbohydrate ABC transporter permease [Schaedlerella arabinosiphila]|jgi:raffinose/stachyose/melibiose transport system permease protein|uniref:carbohydrate ABC transporter permease n=1 Tax=Schaedlerella arabinosiphila TaxID=2044587 RepID=UPI0025583C50|nr:carbohydrate ABC transporter permease [Schaedlerella arabinosiphila]